jgi:hypothetical protein
MRTLHRLKLDPKEKNFQASLSWDLLDLQKELTHIYKPHK